MFIKNCKIIYKDKIENGSILIKNGKISEINPVNPEFTQEIDAKGQYVSPGFIDIHIHGSGGQDVMNATEEAISTISKIIATKGTTSFLPTTMTMSFEKINNSLSAIKKVMNTKNQGANILGVHLEGPFISAKSIGAQNPKYLTNVCIENYNKMTENYADIIKSITLAPEEPGAHELIKELTKQGVKCAVAHSVATYDQAIEANKLGLSHATHLYNAMTPLHHRDPGMIGAVMDSEMTAEIICDGIHVAYPVIRVTLNAMGTDRVILITDSMEAGLMPDGKYSLGGQEVIVANGAARISNGALAGSILTMDKAVKNVFENTDLELFEVVKLATYNPAKFCDVENQKGQIKVGLDADLVIFDEKIEVSTVIIGGEIYNA